MIKKFLFIFSCFLFIGVINAKEYSINDMTIRIDDSFWDVYTKDNLDGVSEEIKDEFKSNDTCLYAKSKMNDYEFTIASRDIDTVTNLNNLDEEYSASFLSGFEREFKKHFDGYEMKNYKSNWYKTDYSFVNANFSIETFNISVYSTIVNRKQYDFIYYNNDNTKYEDIDFQDEIIDKAIFDVDESMEEIIFSPRVILKALFEKYFKYLLWFGGPIAIFIICSIYKNKKDKKVFEDKNSEFWN